MRCTVAFLIVIVATAAPCRGQSDSARLHATLAAWAEDAWLRLLDRDAARDGRLSDQGILQRFNATIDPDYQINLIRARFGLLDDADWARHPRGARYWGGSINTRDFAEGAEFKEAVPRSDLPGPEGVERRRRHGARLRAPAGDAARQRGCAPRDPLARGGTGWRAATGDDPSVRAPFPHSGFRQRERGWFGGGHGRFVLYW